MMKHWIPEGATARPLVKWKDFLTRQWKGPDVLLTCRKGYACVFPQDSTSPIWIPDRLIRHVQSHELSKITKTPEVTEIPGVLESRTEGRWGDQKLIESRPEGAKKKPKGEWPFTWGFTVSTSLQAPGASGETCWLSPNVFCSTSLPSSYSSNYLQHGANMGRAEATHSTGWRINRNGRHEATPMVMFVAMLAVLGCQQGPPGQKFIGPICLTHLHFSLLTGWLSPFVFLSKILIFWAGLPSILIMLKQ